MFLEKAVYIVFSSTPYKIGKIIRRLTGEVYNHVSIALDADLTQMYGFARRYYRTPLLGGFVKESLSRYRVGDDAARIRVCRIAVTEAQHRALQARLAEMYARREHYLYNHLSVFTTPFGRLVKIRDSYICVEFVAELMAGLGFDLQPSRYYSVGELEKMLADRVIYTGAVPPADTVDAEYFAPHPAPPLASVKAFLRLLRRIGT